MPEPFIDFFDYEWLLQGSEYHIPSLGEQFGKWAVLEYGIGGWSGYVDDQPLILKTTNINPILGKDSLLLFHDGSVTTPICYLWGSFWQEVYRNPGYLRVLFRVDEWTSNSKWFHSSIMGSSGQPAGALAGPYLGIGLKAGDSPSSPLRLYLNTSIGAPPFQTLKLESFDFTIELAPKVYILEVLKFFSSDGYIKVWLDGQPILNWVDENTGATVDLEYLDTSFPSEGMRIPHLGISSWLGAWGQKPGCRAKIMLDNFVFADERLPSFEPQMLNLTIDSVPQGKTVRVGNHVGETPLMIRVPEGTIPKIGIDPVGFTHWEIEGYPDYSQSIKDLFSSYMEIFTEPEFTPFTNLATTVTRTPAPGSNVGVLPTPPITGDTIITAVYTGANKRTLSADFNEPNIPVTVDGVYRGLSPLSMLLYEGKRKVNLPQIIQ